MLLFRWFLTALSFLAMANLVPGIHVQGFGTALILAVLWGLLLVTLKPLLVVLTLPINIITLGLFTLVINAALLFVLGSLIKGFEVAGFFPAFVGALFLSLVQTLLQWALRKRE